MNLRVTVAAAAVVVLCGPGATPIGFDAKTLAALEPTALFMQMCGTKDRGATLRARLFEASAAELPSVATDTATVPLVKGLGGIRFPVSTTDAQAQAYFDQGLAFTYGFNHDGAIRSFQRAQQLDPDCAMCFWGEAYALGPNINAGMEPDAIGQALAAVRRAQALAGRATPKERALIEAIALRYSDAPGANRAALDEAYEAAMRAAAARYPNDDDLQVLAAEAAMNRQPWDYWEADGVTPKGQIGRAIETVERVLARNPDHPQAAHLYIHLMEASANPQKAEPFADRLANPLAADSGHLVHMPAHIYFRVGRWKDSIEANVAAARADEAWFKAAGAAASYRYTYYPHNVHFIVTSAQMAGDSRTALEQSKRLREVLDVETAAKLGWVQVIWAAPSFAHAQFSDKRTILAQPAPDPRLPYAVASWRYARAVARAGERSPAAFEAELAELRRLRDTADFSTMEAGGVPARTLLDLAETAALARRSQARGDLAAAERHWRAAVKLEDAIPYMEPPYWYFPTRQSLGATLLMQGRAEEARDVFTDALVRSPNNGWALYGLTVAERRLGDLAASEAANRALQRAWLGDRRTLRLERL